MSAVEPGTLGELMPFARLVGVELVSASKDEVVGTLAWSEELCTTFGVMHGGAVMAFADSVAAYCAVLNLPEGAGTTTIESKTNFLRAVRSGKVTATSRPLHAGRTVIVVDTELRDAEGKLVARTTQTQAVLAAR